MSRDDGNKRNQTRDTIYLNQNSQAVKKECGPQGEKICEIQGGGQEMAVMVG